MGSSPTGHTFFSFVLKFKIKIMGSNKSAAINTGEDFKKVKDLRGREKNIIDDIYRETGFEIGELIWSSDYFGSGVVGAVTYRGKYKNKKAVLKIQGAKPAISEVEMIESFEKQNKSKLIRTPKIFWRKKWNDKSQYEAIIMEEIWGNKIVEEGKISGKENIKEFFDIYREYRDKCIRKPWLGKEKNKEKIGEMIEKAWQLSLKIKPESPFRRGSNKELASTAASLLEKTWGETEKEFVHGHLSVNDIKKQGSEVIIFSNLFWKWKYPFYDAVFGYHWQIYSLHKIAGIGPELIEEQRNLWLEEIYKLGDRKLIGAALLERAIAGLLLDSFAYIDSNNPVAGYLVEATRAEVKRLIKELE
ncbi:TPA: hypothetical protein DIC29_03910 [Candidatus Shapirobacteria bacterium]|nr:hypothetical protein [Candidatus Shapirobacteria bacterium]HCU55567.1 hypothetical protein [Candidatus Shapirobacteria bacterium]